jgi:hypothetical protein
MSDGICYKCFQEDMKKRAENNEWTPSFMVDMGKHVPCKRHK